MCTRGQSAQRIPSPAIPMEASDIAYENRAILQSEQQEHSSVR